MASRATSSTGLAAGLGEAQDHFAILIRFNARQTYMLDVTIKETIRDVKEKLAVKAGTPANNINLILAGQLLHNHFLIQDYGLAAHTTLHAFCWSDDGLSTGIKAVSLSTPSTEAMATSFPESLSSTTSTSNSGSPVDDIYTTCARNGGSSVDATPTADDITTTCSRNHGTSVDATHTPLINGRQRFFVFCKICDCVRPGKLRVKCRDCGSGAFLVDRGPSDWSDISQDTSIRGECKTCNHNVPMFYMRCSESHTEETTGTAVVLRHLRANRRLVECIICSDVMSIILIYPCSRGHVICLDCFRRYCSSCLSERRFIEHSIHGYTLPCPAGCPDAHIEESHHFLVMGKDKYERYKNFAAEEFVLQNGGILCPSPGCGMGLFPEGDQRSVHCRECRRISCRDCLRDYHDGDCEEYLQSQTFSAQDIVIDEEQAQRACWEQSSLSLIDTTTKACPGCKTKTERSGGCMHMVCTRCEHEWCWMCVKTWDRECQADHWFG